MEIQDEKPLRKIRSFMRRQKRLSKFQQYGLEVLAQKYAQEVNNQVIDLDVWFGRQAPRIVEIGFGNGAALLSMATAHPENDYLGIEVHRQGVGNLLWETEQQGLGNIRVIANDAVEVLQKMIPDAALDAVHLFFPDPWRKNRHHKRRIVQPEFAQLLRRRLKPGGIFHMATDWQDYARHMMMVMSAAEGFENIAGLDNYTPRPGARPLTKYEQRGERLGHEVWDLVFRKIS